MTDNELERLKMYQDSFKHMMTFSSGGIVLCAAVTGALFPKPDRVGLLAVSIFLLVIGAAAATSGLVFVPRSLISEDIDYITTRFGIMHRVLWISVGGAYFGLSVFAFFAVINIWS